MKLSTKGRYGARAMLDLALHYGKGPVLLKEVARRQEISQRYLEQLIIPLKLAGLVRSMRGRRGGYVLAKPPKKISLFEIVKVLEGSLSLVECIGDAGLCHRARLCAMREIWDRLDRQIGEALQSTTLQDMAKRQRKKLKR